MNKEYDPIDFRINSEEAKVLNEWMGYIYSKHGKYGKFEYKFKDKDNLKYDVWVYNDLEKSEICLTTKK
jgi:hypothetical protein